MAAAGPLVDVIDLDRYPTDSCESPAGRQLVRRCRAELDTLGAGDLPGFVWPDAITATLASVADARTDADRTDTPHTTEFSGVEHHPPDDDPLRIQVRSAKSLLAYDQIPGSSPLRVVYESDALTRLVGLA